MEDEVKWFFIIGIVVAGVGLIIIISKL